VDNATVVEALKRQLGDAVLNVVEFRKQLIVWLEPSRLVQACQFLRDEPQLRYNFLSDVSCVDRLGMQAEGIPSGQDPLKMNDALRFVVNYQLLSMPNKHRLWLKVGLPADDPHVASLVPLWPSADFLEREVFDLMGVKFDGHPDLRRILMPDDWQGHPLRKDYPLGFEEVQFSHNFERVERHKKFART
jgi:NADH-quinone oxidoreductase subunit C